MAHQKFHGRPAQRMRDQLRRKRMPCWICGGEIDYDAKPGHPRSFTVDHVLSQKLNPELTFHRDNMRAACWSCNSRKGTGSADKIKPPPRSREW